MVKRFIVGLVGFLILPFNSLPLVFADSGGSVVFSEIAWMGTSASANDEWIELYNGSASSVDLSGWKITDPAGTINISLTGTVAAQSFFLLERTDDTSVNDISANQIYTGALKNDGDTLTLLDNLGQPVDTVDQWYGGNNTAKSTMERVDAGRPGNDVSNWCTNDGVTMNGADANGGVVHGTPGRTSSCWAATASGVTEPDPEPSPEAVPEAEPDPDPVPEGGTPPETGGGGGGTPADTIPADSPPADSSEPPGGTPPGPVLSEVEGIGGGGGGTPSAAEPETAGQPPIDPYTVFPQLSEIMVNPDGPDEGNEWIELFNPRSEALDLSGWQLDDAPGASKPFKIPPGTMMAPNAYLVFGGAELKLSLKNSSDQVRLLDPNGVAKDSVSYAEAEGKATFARDVDGQFKWTSIVTPGEMNGFQVQAKHYAGGAVAIVAALPDPEGADAGNEIIVLQNTTGEAINLADWKMQDAQSHETVFSELILAPRESRALTQDIFHLSLGNSAEGLRLYDATGGLIDEWNWDASDSGRVLFNAARFPDELSAPVTRGIDGDTFEITWLGQPLSVRLLGVDAPETVHPTKAVERFGKEASDFLTAQVFGQTLRLTTDVTKFDKYHRLLAYAYLGDRFINAELLQKGFARAYTWFPFRFKETFVGYQTAAQAAKVGLWNDEIVTRVMESRKDDVEETEKEKNIPLLEQEGLGVVVKEEDPGGEKQPTEKETVPCDSPSLKLDAILPNPKKGDGEEFIRLINAGAGEVCLAGWQLDDAQGAGSKPFAIKGGAIAAGATRTFLKNETRLALNNANDCATLISPLGVVADQLCYGKTHPGEQFTHAGGDWEKKQKQAPPGTGGVGVVAKKKNKIKEPSRDPLAYAADMPSVTLVGQIASIDPAEEKIVVALADHTSVPVSYAGSRVDIDMVKMLVDIKRPVVLSVRPGLPAGQAGADIKQLVSIEQPAEKPEAPATASSLPLIALFSMAAATAGWFIGRRRISEKS